MLATRIITGAVLVAAVLAALFFLPPRWWSIAALVVMLVAAEEWASLGAFGHAAKVAFVLGMAAFAIILVFIPGFAYEIGWPSAVVAAVCGAATAFWVLVVPPWLHFRAPLRSKVVAALVGWLVLVAAWMALVQLRAQSPERLLAFMAIVWIADTAAYFTGRALGKHKLAPEISPGKTWEGAIGGVGGVMLYAIALAVAAPRVVGVSTASAIALWTLFAMAVAALSVCGDLFESLLKRQAGLKDSGRILPGHGGMLDRVDALLAALPPLALVSVLWLQSLEGKG